MSEEHSNRTCRECGVTKSRNKFTKDKKCKYGRTYLCYDCRNILYQSKYVKNNASKNKDSKLRYKFNITLEQFNEILDKQENKCACCGEQLVRKLNIDHDHSCCDSMRSCGKCIRGILCTRCNNGLGAFNDNIEKLQRAIQYLQETKKG